MSSKSARRLIVAVLASVAGAMFVPSPASATWFKDFGWVVLDNGALGLPGNNQYAYVCGGGDYSGGSLSAETAGWDQTGCTAGGGVYPDPDRYVVELKLTVNGVQCGAVVGDGSDAGYHGVEVSKSSLCGANGSNSVETRTYSYFKGGFCGPGECAYGYVTAVRTDRTI